MKFYMNLQKKKLMQNANLPPKGTGWAGTASKQVCGRETEKKEKQSISYAVERGRTGNAMAVRNQLR